MKLYDKTKNLKHKFDGWENIEKNYSQAYQDLFVLTALNGKKDGTYLDIGAREPDFISNTYLLEQMGWTGVSIDIEDLGFNKLRRNTFLLANALTLDYEQVLANAPKQIDYLSIDIEPKTQTLECLKKLPLDKYRFSVITYETDFYDKSQGDRVSEQVRAESRKILQDLGYELIVGNVGNLGSHDLFEDWYVDPTVVSKETIDKLKVGDWNESAEKYMTI